MYKVARFALLFWLLLPVQGGAQKGSWQLRLEKRLHKAKGQEERLLLTCAIAQEVKEYDLEKASKLAYQTLQTAQRLGLKKAVGEAYYTLADVVRMRGRYAQALAYQQQASAHFQQTKDEESLQRSRREVAFNFSALSKFDSARYILEESLGWFEKNAPQTREHALTLYAVGVNHLRSGTLQEADQYAQKAQKIFATVGDAHGEARTKNLLGLIYKNMGWYKKGLKCYTEALHAFQEIGEHQRSTSIVLLNIGNLYLMMSDTLYREQMFKNYGHAHKISLAIRDTFQTVACLEALARAEAFLKHPARARLYYEEGLKFLRHADNYVEEGYYSLRLSDIFMTMSRSKDAIDIIRKTLEMFERKQDWGAVVRAQYYLAKALAATGEHADSQQVVEGLLRNIYRAGDNTILTFVCNIALRNAIALRRYEEAEKWGKIAIQILPKTQRHDFLLQTYAYLIAVDTLQKKPTAVRWFGAYHQLRDSLLKQNRGKDLFEMQFKYDLQDQLRENKYLKELNELQRLEAQERQIAIFTVTIALFLMVATAFFLLRNRRKLQRVLAMVRDKNLDIVQKNAEIETQNHNLAKLNLTKDRILSIISHDMRSPLANLTSVLDLANSGDISLEEQISLTQRLNKDIGRVQGFLRDLLYWAESQMAGFTPKNQPIALYELAGKMFDILEPQAKKKGVALVNCLQEEASLTTDKDILHIVLMNLVSNALKFTPEGGEICLEAVATGEMMRISVRDNGVGIEETAQDRIFGNARFTTNGTNEEKGTGFGLMLCRDFIHVLGGELSFYSKVGQGTTFFIDLPI